jgi:integrase
MGRPIEKLSAKQIERLAKTPGKYGDGGGLWLVVASKHAVSWVFRYQIAGNAREMGLGSFDVVSLAEARSRALAARKLSSAGIDPIAERDRQQSERVADATRAITFKQSAEGYIGSHGVKWSNAKHADQWRATLESYVYPLIGDLPTQSIDDALVHKILDRIWLKKPETASRVRGRIEAILNWATARGYRTGLNPARWKGHLENSLPARSQVRAVKHHAALPYREIGSFMAKLREQKGSGARALEFAILTAARTGEVIGATWDEIDIETAMWTIPAMRMKAKREHRVPLSLPAVALLRELGVGKGAVFREPRTGAALSNAAMLSTLRRMKRTDLTTHGFRSTFRDWAAEQTSFPGEVAEMALAHTIENKVEATYRRGDLFEKRQKLMAAWASYCEGGATGNVISIQSARSAEANDATIAPTGEPPSDDLSEALEAYNLAATAARWRPCLKLSDAQRSALAAILVTHGGARGWATGMVRATKSSFFERRTPGSRDREGWTPTIDSFLRPGKFAKLMRGGYDDGAERAAVSKEFGLT